MGLKNQILHEGTHLFNAHLLCSRSGWRRHRCLFVLVLNLSHGYRLAANVNDRKFLIKYSKGRMRSCLKSMLQALHSPRQMMLAARACFKMRQLHTLFTAIDIQGKENVNEWVTVSKCLRVSGSLTRSVLAKSA